MNAEERFHEWCAEEGFVFDHLDAIASGQLDDNLELQLSNALNDSDLLRQLFTHVARNRAEEALEFLRVVLRRAVIAADELELIRAQEEFYEGSAA